MTLPDKKCPRCGLWNAASALVCDCGFDFKSGQVTVSPLVLSTAAKPDIRDKIQRQVTLHANALFWFAGAQVVAFFSIPFPASLFTVFTGIAFIVSGLLARRRYSGGFYLGAITCIVEMLLCLGVKNYGAAAGSFILLYWMWRGIQALRLSSMLSLKKNPQIMLEAVNAARSVSLYRTPGLAFRIAFWIWLAGAVVIAGLFWWFLLPR